VWSRNCQCLQKFWIILNNWLSTDVIVHVRVYVCVCTYEGVCNVSYIIDVCGGVWCVICVWVWLLWSRLWYVSMIGIMITVVFVMVCAVKWMEWCGLIISPYSLDVRVDYSRYQLAGETREREREREGGKNRYVDALVWLPILNAWITCAEYHTRICAYTWLGLYSFIVWCNRVIAILNPSLTQELIFTRTGFLLVIMQTNTL